MITCKEIDDYIEYVEEHPEWINEARHLLIENVVKPTLEREDIWFDESTYRNCIKYCEANYYDLFPYQKFIYAFVFMYYLDDNEPVFPNFVIFMGRGNGKDGFMVPLANFLQTPLYGQKNYHIEVVANAEDQAKDTFNVAYNMLDSSTKFKGKFKWTKEIIKNLQTGSEFKYNTSNAKSKDGKKIGCILFNEYHAYENYDQINVFESALGKVDRPRKFIFTTNGYVREGPLDELLDMLMSILKSGENALGYFPFLCMLDDKTEVDNEDAWHKANPSMEFRPSLQRQIKKDYLEMKRLPSKMPEFMTKRMNLPERKEEQTVTSWNNILRCCYSDIETKEERADTSSKGQLAVIGIDYADIRDFASAGYLIKVDDEYVWRQHTWICAQSPFFNSIKFPIKNIGLEGYNDFEVCYDPVIPIEAIVSWCEKIMSEYQVTKIAMDTYRYTLFKQVFEQHGISIEDKQHPDGIVRLIRKIASVTGIIAPFMESLYAEGKMNYGNSSIMRWYTNNTMVTTDKFGNKTFGKIEPKLRKNDGFMALMVAMFCKDELEEVVIYV